MEKLEKIRVLHVHGDLVAGGGQVLSREWLSRLDKDKFDSRVVVLNSPLTLKESFEENDIPVHLIFGNRFMQIIKLSKYIRDNDIDIVHTQSERDRKVGHWAALISRKPVVASLHSKWVYFLPVKQKSKLRNIKSGVALWLRKLSDRSVLCFVATSTEVKNEFDKFTNKKVFVCEPGVSVAKASNAKQLRETTRKKLGVMPNQKLIINASRIDSLKNLDDFVVSVAKLKGEHDVLGHIYGEGEKAEHIAKLINDLDANEFIKIFEPTVELSELLNASDIYLATSLSESFGMSILEAMSCGLPVVAYDLPAYEKFSRSICVVNTGDVDRLVQEASKLISNKDEYSKLATSGIETSKNFDIKIGTEKLQEIYKQVMSKV